MEDALEGPPRYARWVDRLWLLPLLAAVASLISARVQGWVPVSDGAVAAVRAADVLRGHMTPLGLPASISEFAPGPQRYHPGPLLFWALAPFTGVFGIQLGTTIGTIAINTAASVGAIRATNRAHRPRLTVLMAVTALLTGITVWGPGHLYDPFNTMLPAITLLCGFVLAWRLFCGDGTMLPWAIVLASFAIQTHVVYAVPLLVTLVPAALVAIGPPRWRPAGAERPSGRRIALSAVLGVFLWSWPAVEALANGGGNIRNLFAGTSGAAVVGVRGAVATFVQVANVPPVQFRSISDATFLHSANVSAVLLGAFAIWLAVRAVRSGDAVLRRLVAVAGLAVVGAALTTMQLPDEPLENAQMTFFKVVVPFTWFALLGSWAETWTLPAKRVRLIRGAALGLAVIVAVEACVPFQIRNGYDIDSWIFDGTTDVSDEIAAALPADQPYRIDARGGTRYLLLLYGVIADLQDRGWDLRVTRERETNYGSWKVADDDEGRTTIVLQDPLVAPPEGGEFVAAYRPEVDEAARAELEAELLRRAKEHGTVRLTSPGQNLLAYTLVDRPGIDDARVQAIQDDPTLLLEEDPSILAALYRNEWVVEPTLPSDLKDEFHRLLGPTAVDIWAVPGG
ncbi:MAG TPA: hypothetical protein VNS19_22575 [Acidimicrobiales bacterium]|nr:hypothetical protein [Acidimicrobiales bacterium]